MANMDSTAGVSGGQTGTDASMPFQHELQGLQTIGALTAQGTWESAQEDGQNLWNAITHPIDTFNAIVQSQVSPFQNYLPDLEIISDPNHTPTEEEVRRVLQDIRGMQEAGNPFMRVVNAATDMLTTDAQRAQVAWNNAGVIMNAVKDPSISSEELLKAETEYKANIGPLVIDVGLTAGSFSGAGLAAKAGKVLGVEAGEAVVAVAGDAVEVTNATVAETRTVALVTKGAETAVATEGTETASATIAAGDAAGADGAAATARGAGELPPAERPIVKDGAAPAIDAPVVPIKYTPEQMSELWESQVAENGAKPMQMVKGYYEARVTQVDAATNPNGILISSTESPMTLQKPITIKYPDGSSVELKAGTTLPNGVQFSPKAIEIDAATETSSINGARLNISTADGTISLSDGTVLRSGGEISDPFSVNKGQVVKPDSYVIARDSVDPATGNPRIDTYYNKDLSRWQEVPGKPGTFSPAPNRMGGTPTEMVRVPAGYEGQFEVSYGGSAPIKEGDWIVKSGNGYYRVSEADAAETYLPVDEATSAAMKKSLTKMRANGANVRVAAQGAEDYSGPMS